MLDNQDTSFSVLLIINPDNQHHFHSIDNKEYFTIAKNIWLLLCSVWACFGFQSSQGNSPMVQSFYALLLIPTKALNQQLIYGIQAFHSAYDKRVLLHKEGTIEFFFPKDGLFRPFRLLWKILWLKGFNAALQLIPFFFISDSFINLG